MDYLEFMSIRDLRDRKRELQGYIHSGYTFLYDNSIVQYDREVIDDFEDEIREIDRIIEERVGRTLVRLSLIEE